MRQLVRAYPKRILLIGLVALLVNFGSETAGFYAQSYLQTEHSWQPWHVTLLTVGLGMISIFGSTAVGQLGDRFERKWLASFFIVATSIAILLFYTSTGILLPLTWCLMLLAFRGMGITLATMGAELFPTSSRSTAAGAQSLLANGGIIFAFLAHSLLTQSSGSPWQAIWLLSLALLLSPFLLAFLPNTKGRSLEEIAPEVVESSVTR